MSGQDGPALGAGVIWETDSEGDGEASRAPRIATVAALWEYPHLCLAFFGAQFSSAEGQRLYEEAGIEEEMFLEMEAARKEGLLLNRPLMTQEGPVLMQYWRSYEELDRWARKLPHSRWWRWLLENTAHGVGFYHEIYQVSAAEAIYEQGTPLVGPALFATAHEVRAGAGESRARQRHFAEVAATPPPEEEER